MKRNDIPTAEQKRWRARVARWCAFGALISLSLAGHSRQTVRGSDLARFAGAPLAGVVMSDETVTVDIDLGWRDSDGLQALLEGLYDPKSPLYRHFLSPSDFTRQYGPDTDEYQKVVDFAQARHLSVTATCSSRLIVTAWADAQTIQSVFGVTLRLYRRPDGSVFRAPDRDPSLDLDVPIAGVSGLDNYARPRSLSVHGRVRPRLRPDSGTGTQGSYQGYDFRDAYGVPAALQGSGQTIGFVEFSGFQPSDIQTYETSSNPALPLNTPVAVSVDGGGGLSDTQFVNEASLDLEVGDAMAPQAALVAYEGPSSGSSAEFDDILSMIAGDPNHFCRQISCSWGDIGDGTTSDLVEQLAAQGQSFLVASGDDGAYGAGDVDPAPPPPLYLNPYMTVVGGTELTTSAPAGSPPATVYVSETTWNDYNPTVGDGGSGGGGICLNLLTQPAYQNGATSPSDGGSTHWRNLPDVAMNATNFLVVAMGTTYPSGSGANDYTVEGTSGACPLWTAFAALANEQAATSGAPPLGFLNPALYAIGESAQLGTAFHNIADNSNNNRGGTDLTYYSAVAGYNLTTGWGSPNGQAMLVALQTQATALGTSGSLFPAGGSLVRFVTYPNPYNPRLGVLFLTFAPSTNGASLDVYDTAYRPINSVILDQGKAFLGKGTYSGLDSNGQRLSPGTYFAVLRSSGAAQTCMFTVLP